MYNTMLEEIDEKSLQNNEPHRLFPLSSVDLSSNRNSLKMTKYGESSSKQSDVPLVFGPLEDGGERYLKEAMMLPHISPMTGTKYYVNLHPTESDYSSSEDSQNNWWEFLEYDEITNNYYSSSISDLKDKPHKEIDNLKTNCLKTEKMIRDRKLNINYKENEERHKLISNLENQMTSLYNIKKQYKKNLFREICLKRDVRKPARGDSDKLSRQRDLIVERIKRNKTEEDKRKQKQIERKISIVKRLLEEQRKRELTDHLFQKQEPRNISNLPKIVHHEIHSSHFSIEEKEIGHNVSEVAENVAIETTEDPKTVPEITEHFETSKLEQVQEDGKITLGSDNPKTNKKKQIKQLSTILPEKNTKKKGNITDKKKKKGSKEVESHAAISEETYEPPRSEMKDLLLWCENWRETHDVDIRWQKYMDAQKLPLAEDVVLRPTTIVFNDVEIGRVLRQEIEVRNTGRAPLQCRVAAVVPDDPPTASTAFLQLKAKLEGPSKARIGQHWTLVVTLDALEPVEDTSLHVWLEFCREDCRTQLSAEVRVVTPRARPVLSTAFIRFGPQVCRTAIPVTKWLKVNNFGSMGCILRWDEPSPAAGQVELPPTTQDGLVDCHDTSSENWTSSNGSKALEHYSKGNGATAAAKAMLELALERVFRVFRIESRQNTLVPPHSTVTLPIRFRPAMAAERGDVFTMYKLSFYGECVQDSEQELVICGHIEDSPLTLKPAVLDLRVCYLGGGVQQGLFCVCNSATHSVTVTAHVPSPLAHCVSVRPREAVILAQSSTTLALRIVLSWDFLDVPCRYLDRNSGLLCFPILVSPHGPQTAPPLELPVMCLVAPACPLTINPSLIALGQVSTQETVSATFNLTNHLALPYNFSFVNLPQSVLIEPGGGVGTILPNECLELRVFFSPYRADPDIRCGQPGWQAEANLVLRCFTTISLASPSIENKRNDSTASHKPDDAESIAQCISSGYSQEEISTLVLVQNEAEDALSNIKTDRNSNGITDEQLNINNDDSKTLEDCISRDLKDDDITRTSIHTMDSSTSNSEKSGDPELWDYYSSFHFNIGNTSSESAHHNDANVDSNIKFVKFTSETKMFPETHTIIENRIEELPLESQRCASLVLQALVVDPLVELSAQTVVLPHTPFQSYSVAHIHVRCRHQRKCNVHRRKSTFKTWFEFQSPSEHVQVEPREGFIHYNQNIKIALIFRPVLSQEQIYAKALETKVEFLKQMKIKGLLDQYYKAKEKKGGKKGSIKEKKSVGKKSINTDEIIGKKDAPIRIKATKANKKSKPSIISKISKKSKISIKTKKLLKKKDSGPLTEVTIDPATVEVTEDDLRAGKTLLLKYMETVTQTVTVRCHLETQLTPDSDETQQEMTELQVVCTTEPPCIAPSTSTCLEFGPVAVGARSKLRAQLTNISFFDITVDMSTLNPIGMFSCTTALEMPLNVLKDVVLPPEHILTVPILFRPSKEGNVVERFEVTSGTSVLQLQARGEGIVPSFKLSPDQEVFNLACAVGKKADLTLSITNMCEAPLPFNISQVFLKKGRSLPKNTLTSPDSPNSVQKIGKPLKQKNGKVQKQFGAVTPELMTCLQNDFVDFSDDTLVEPVFKLINVNKSFDVLSEETKGLVIRFTPPQKVISEITKHDSLKRHPNNAIIGIKTNKSPKIKKSLSKHLNSNTDTVKKNKGDKKSELVDITADKEKNDYNIYAVKYELNFANVEKVKELIILAVVKIK